jgi:hypothetical protein
MADLRKPAKGSGLIARTLSKKARRAFEERQKAIVRKRDQRCRWPRCENCRLYKPRLEVAHVVRAKGMGGDHGTVSTPRHLMLLDCLTHAEEERNRRSILPRDAALGTDGACEFWVEDDGGTWLLAARESAPFVLERD